MIAEYELKARLLDRERPVSPPMNGSNRCDRCVAQAAVRIFLETPAFSALELCGHHYDAHAAALFSHAWWVDDQRINPGGC